MFIEKQLFLIQTPKIWLFFVILLIFQSKTYLEMSYSNQPCTRWRRERNKACCAPPSCFQSVQANPSSSLYTQCKTTVILSVYQWQLSLFAKQNKTKHKTKSVVCWTNSIQSGSSPHYFAAFICVSNKLQTEHVQ